MTGDFWRDHAVLFTVGTERTQADYLRLVRGETLGKVTAEEYNERMRQLVDQAKATR